MRPVDTGRVQARDRLAPRDELLVRGRPVRAALRQHDHGLEQVGLAGGVVAHDDLGPARKVDLQLPIAPEAADAQVDRRASWGSRPPAPEQAPSDA